MEKFIIYGSLGNIKGTTLDNYNARISDARLISTFSDFDNIPEVIDYVVKYFGYTVENIIIKA